VRRAVALCFLGLASCAGVAHEWQQKPQPQLPLALVFDTGMDAELERPLREAAAYWNIAAGRTLFVDATYAKPDDYNDIVFVQFKWASYSDPHHPDRTELAATSPDNVITLYLGFLEQTDADRESTARHELGHVLGFDHSSLVECLMYPIIHPHWYPAELCREEKALLRVLVGRMGS
jgi:Matrixin